MSNPRLKERPAHIAACGHPCSCKLYTCPKLKGCLDCRRKSFKAAMAQRYYQDRLSVSDLLARQT